MIRLAKRIATTLNQPTLPGLLASTFALGTAFSFVAPFLSTWGTEEVGLSPRHFSLFMLAASLSAIVVSTVLARLSDSRFSRRHMLIAGSLGGALGFVGYALIDDPLWLSVIACTLQALASICFAQLFSHVREFFQINRNTGQASTFTLSVVRVCFSFSWTAGPAIGSLVLIRFGFQGLFLGAAGLYLAFLLGVLLFVPQASPVSSSAQPKASVFKTLRRPDLLACFVAFAAIFAANAVNMMNLPLAVTSVIGGSKSDFGIIFGIGPVVEIPLMLWFGHLAGRGLQVPLIRLGMIVSLAYFVSLYFCAAPWHVYLAQILNGIAFSILTNVAILFFQDLVPGQMGLATSLFSNAGAVGNLAGLLAFGYLVESLGHRNTFLACALLAAIAVGVLAFYRPSDTPQAPAIPS